MPQENSEPDRRGFGGREYRRVRLTTQVQCVALGRKDTLVTRDISLGGLLIVTKTPYPADTEIDLSLSLPSAGTPVSCRGQVGYTIEGCGMGVKFVELSEESHLALKRFVHEANCVLPSSSLIMPGE